MVIAIIAVLISIAIPVFNGSMKKAANAYGKLNGTIVPTWENFFHNNQRIGSLTFKGRKNRCVFVHEKFNGSR